MKQQIIVIHGGDSFNSYEEYISALKTWPVKRETFLPRKNDWKDDLQISLGKNYEILQPRMPNKQNSRFIEWKIWFERMFPFLDQKVILVGHSLGGMFLAKYLAENKFPKQIIQLHLVAAPHNRTADIGDFTIPNDLSGISKQSKIIYLYQSKDDPIVDFSELGVWQESLRLAKSLVFEDRGHFVQESLPELIENIESGKI